MAATVTATVANQLIASVNQAAGSSPAGNGIVAAGSPPKRYANGTGFSQADLAGSVRGSLAGSGTVDVDLSGGLTDGVGNTITPAKAVVIAITNFSAASALTLKKSASNGLAGLLSGTTDSLTIGPGLTGEPNTQLFIFPRGLTITAGTADKILLTNTSSSETVEYMVTVLGRSA